MNKEIVYLIHTPDYLPKYMEILDKMGRDVYLLSYKKPVKYKNSIFFPCTYGEGKNKLAEIVSRKYKYYLFMDEDGEVFMRDPSLSHLNALEKFENLLLEYEPAIGSPSFPNCSNKKKIKKGEIETTWMPDTGCMAFHRDAMKICYPMYYRLDIINMDWTEQINWVTFRLAFEKYILSFFDICWENGLHRGGRVKYRRRYFWDKFYKTSLLYEEDKKKIDEGFKWRNGRSSTGIKYKKPYPGEYLELAEDFKKRVKKDHNIWKNNPFING